MKVKNRNKKKLTESFDNKSPESNVNKHVVKKTDPWLIHTKTIQKEFMQIEGNSLPHRKDQKSEIQEQEEPKRTYLMEVEGLKKK